MTSGPVRGTAVRGLGLQLPPQAMAGWHRTRPLKHWRYLGVYTPEVMLCVGDARIGPLRQRFWAVAWPDGALAQRTTIGRGGVQLEAGRARVSHATTRIDLLLDEPAAVETVSPAVGGYIWTAKRAPVQVTGTVAVGSRRHEVTGAVGFVDDSAGYHDRHTVWKWSAGIGATEAGSAVAWNLVEGIHDDSRASERTLWIDGEPTELGANAFAADLSSVAFAEGGRLDFAEWTARTDDTDLVLLKSRYRQPFGAFTGELPGGHVLARGHGVMEDHDVWW